MTFLFYLCVETVALFLMSRAAVYKINTEKATKQAAGFPARIKTSYIKRRNSLVVRQFNVYDVYFFFSFFILFLVIALRDGVGMDYFSYVDIYTRIVNRMETAYDKTWLGMGFVWLCRLSGFIAGKNYFIMFAITGALTIYFFSKSVYKLSPSWTMSLYLYLCFCLYYQCFNQIRQMLAISVTTYAFTFLTENKPLKFTAYVILATFFHPSAIIMIVLCFVRKWNIDFKHMTVYAFICLFFLSFYNIVIFLISRTHYAHFLDWSRMNGSLEYNAVLNLAVRIVMLGFCLFYSKETLGRKPYLITMYHAAIICTVLQIMTVRAYYLGRTTTYFFMSYIFLIPETMLAAERHLTKSLARWFRLAVILILFAYHFVYYHTKNPIETASNVYKMVFFS